MSSRLGLSSLLGAVAAIASTSDLAALISGGDPVLAMAEAIRPSYKGPAPRTAPRTETGKRIRVKRTDRVAPPGPRHFGWQKIHNPYDPVVGAHLVGTFRWVELTAPRS